ncbi:hypothetical protein GPJ56_002143 [Histomonas meleagridis]|uniref:uncharacterized protein n=1 Tax=Histomonas meleagridis TaxID=135588 RepID=UPI00355A0AE8|nr:hypothetical protein GPJ56_002143 [Histomonas meleagridis]KAH0806678.1 hypothetical protein GO595_000529 [Histomonas meleagridis]
MFKIFDKSDFQRDQRVRNLFGDFQWMPYEDVIVSCVEHPPRPAVDERVRGIMVGAIVRIRADCIIKGEESACRFRAAGVQKECVSVCAAAGDEEEGA